MASAPVPEGPPVAVRPCPVCGAPVAHDAVVCPNCGTALQRRRGPDLALVVAGILAVAVGVLLALLLTRDSGDAGPVVPATTAVTTAATPVTPPASTPAVPNTPVVPSTPVVPTNPRTTPTPTTTPTTTTEATPAVPTTTAPPGG